MTKTISSASQSYVRTYYIYVIKVVIGIWENEEEEEERKNEKSRFYCSARTKIVDSEMTSVFYSLPALLLQSVI